MRKKHLFFVLAVSIILLAGCTMYKQAIALNMADIRLGMTRPEMIKILGKPNMIVSAYKGDNGDLIEVLEYVTSERRYIWTYFVNNELFEWGPGENWETDAAFKRAIMNRSMEYQLNRGN